MENEGYYVERFLEKTLLKMHMITEEQLRKCQKIQTSHPRPLPLAFILIDQGYINDETLHHLIDYYHEYFDYLAKYEIETLLGEEFVEKGVLSKDQLKEALEIQRSQHSYVPLVVILEEKGYMQEESINKVVREQTEYFQSLVNEGQKKRFGEICVEKDWITKKHLDYALKYQQKLFSQGIKLRIGKILINKGLITEADVFEILKIQGKRVYECSYCDKMFNVRYYIKKSLYPCPSCNKPLTPIADFTESEKEIKKEDIINLEENPLKMSKAKIVIEQALEESESFKKKEKDQWNSSSWWRKRIDEILTKQGPGISREPPILPTPAPKLDNIDTRKRFFLIYLTISSPVLIMIAVPLFFILTQTTTQKQQPSPILSPTLPYNQEKKAYIEIPKNHEEKHNPKPQPDKPQANIFQKNETPFQKALRDKESAKDILEIIKNFTQNGSFLKDDFSVLKYLYYQFHNDDEIRVQIIQSIASLARDKGEELPWLENILQTASNKDQITTVYALYRVGGDAVHQVLLTNLRITTNENLIPALSETLVQTTPKDQSLFNDLTVCFSRVQGLDVKMGILHSIGYLETGGEGEFFLRVASDRSLNPDLRIKAIKTLTVLSRDRQTAECYRKELEGILYEEKDGPLKRSIQSTINALLK